MNRFVNLSVATSSDEDHYMVFQHLSELAANMSDQRVYVAVATSEIDETSSELEISSDDNLYYDDATLDKVHTAINKAIQKRVFSVVFQKECQRPDFSDMIVNELQNAGILFRERQP